MSFLRQARFTTKSPEGLTRIVNLVAAAATLILFTCFVASSAVAGGGPENAVLVVNTKSRASMRIANAYAIWRQFPAENVIHLDSVPDDAVIQVPEFRKSILLPVMEEIRKRGLAGHVNYIIYSADFPTAVRVKADVDKLKQELPAQFKPTASINALTYLYTWTMDENAGYMQLEVNNYYRKTFDETLDNPIRGRLPEEFSTAVEAYREANARRAINGFQAMLEKSRSIGSIHYWLARCHMLNGDEEKAREELERVLEFGWPFRDDTAADPAFQSVASSDWFKALLAKMPATARGARPTTTLPDAGKWGLDGLWLRPAKEAWQSPPPYFLSTVLATPINDAMSVEESLEQLKRSVEADFTHPKGTFYFLNNNGVRARTRAVNFDEAVRDLKRLNQSAEVLTQATPRNRRDVLGLVAGVASFDWPKSGSKIMPGAICEHLTSFGGRIHRPNAKQTLLTEYLRAGAAGASGTVDEPYAIQNKFPLPYMHVHYARGASLAEAFYQSVYGPYQLLIVGDALCQPFGTPPEFTIEGLDENQTIKEAVSLSVMCDNPDSIQRFDLFVDGRLWARTSGFEESLAFDPANSPIGQISSISPGYHELRVVAISNSTSATQARKIIPFYFESKLTSLELTESDTPTSLRDSITINLDIPDAEQIVIFHEFQPVAVGQGGTGKVDIPCSRLGVGDVRLRLAAKIDNQIIFGPPQTFTITP